MPQRGSLYHLFQRFELVGALALIAFLFALPVVRKLDAYFGGRFSGTLTIYLNGVPSPPWLIDGLLVVCAAAILATAVFTAKVLRAALS